MPLLWAGGLAARDDFPQDCVSQRIGLEAQEGGTGHLFERMAGFNVDSFSLSSVAAVPAGAHDSNLPDCLRKPCAMCSQALYLCGC